MTATLADIERRAIEAAFDRHVAHRDMVKRAAADLRVGITTLYRRLADWSATDRAIIRAQARSVGVSQDEVSAVLEEITLSELASLSGYSKATALRRVREARTLLGYRKVPWGLALVQGPVGVVA